MIRIEQAIVVEGRYDKNKIQQIFDAMVVETGGFSIFKDPKKLELLRLLAKKRGLLVLTDSDGAGFVIRNYLKGAIQEGRVYHAYIPDLYGKERRKDKPSKEGKLGVEGVDDQVIIQAVAQCGIHGEQVAQRSHTPIDRGDLYRLGLSGGPDSAIKRRALLCRLNLPEHLSAGALCQVLSLMMTLEELEALIQIPDPSL